MKADRTNSDRLIDFSADCLTFDGKVALKRRVLNYIKGVKGPRQNPVTTKQIESRFRGTPAEFVHDRLNDLIIEGSIRCVPRSLNSTRRAKGICVYEVAA